MVGPDRAEHARVGRVARLALAPRGQLELLEEDPRELLRRAEHELLARELVRLRLELLDPVAQPRRDLAHPVLVDLDAGVLHRRQHRRQRQLDVAVQVLGAALREPVAEQRREPARALARPARAPSSPPPPRGSGTGSTPYSRTRSSTAYSARPGLDQVRGDHRVVDRLEREPRQRLEVVRDHLRVPQPGDERLVPGADDDALLRRDREPVAGDRQAHPAAQRRKLALVPRHRGAHGLAHRRRHGRLELVDPVQQVAELEPAERLVERAAVGRREHDRGGIEVELEVAAHRREPLRGPRLLGVLA